MNLSPDPNASELLDVFFESAEELLQGMNGGGLALEKNPDDPEQLRHVRRAVHTLKGDSAACGFRELSELAHALEDVLTPELVREKAKAVAEVVLSAADVFGEMLEAYRRKCPAHSRKRSPRAYQKPSEQARAAANIANLAAIRVDGIRTAPDRRSVQARRDRLPYCSGIGSRTRSFRAPCSSLHGKRSKAWEKF